MPRGSQLPSRLWFLAVLTALSLASASCSASGRPDSAQIASPRPLHPSASAYAPGELSLLVEPDQGPAPVYALIASARRAIDLTMYELVDTDAALALELAASRGVAVRVLLDTNLQRGANQAAYDELTAMGVQVAWADPRYAATHQKTLVIDRAVAAVMSMNLTSRYYPTTRDFGLLDRDRADVAAIEHVFEADFHHTATVAPAAAGLVWSPHQSEPTLLSLIDAASSTLLVENEEMAYKPVTAALARAARRGVHVVVMMTDQPQWHNAFDALSAAHVVVRLYAARAPLYIHAKVIVADAATSGARAFMGSENFSAASLQRNRELGVLTSDPAVVAGLAATIESDAAAAQPWRP